MKKCVFSDAGSMVAPEVHDSPIERIDFETGALSIYVRNPDGELNVLKFTGVTHFLCNGMAEQNLILDIWVDSREEESSRVVAILIQGESEAQKFHRANLLKKLANSELKLIQCSPSYGGEFVIVCGEVFLSGVHQRDESSMIRVREFEVWSKRGRD